MALQVEMESRRVDERDHEAVARTTEEDTDERDDQAERTEQREQHHRGLALRWPEGEQVAPIYVRDQGSADQHEDRAERPGDRRVKVGQQLLEAEEVPRRLGDGRRNV